jgi:hypothetical protein
VDRKPQFPKEIFSKDAISLLTGLLHKRPENRLGCGEKGIEEIKDHPFFESIDWGLLEAGYLDPPFVPNVRPHPIPTPVPSLSVLTSVFPPRVPPFACVRNSM